MRNKGLIISLVVFAGILVMLLVTIFLINFPDTAATDFLQKRKIRTTREAIEETEKETESKPEIGYSIAHYTYNDGMNVDIEYPVVYGIENKTYENNINQKINIDATSIILLHDEKDKIDSLLVNCTVQSIDEKEIVITYEGEMYYKSTSSKKSNTSTDTNQNQSTTKKRNNNISADPNYDTYGGYGGGNNYGGGGYDSYNGASNYQIPQNQQPAQNYNYDSYAPISGLQNINMEPNTNGELMMGFASTKVNSKRIFYTSTIDFEDCKDVYLSQYAIVSELAKYARSADCEFANVDDNNIENVRKYIQKSNQTTIQSILQNADYQNKSLTAWPKSFSYKKNNYIYFSLPVSHELGDYVLVRYAYYEN